MDIISRGGDAPSVRARRARIAVAAFFFVNGAMFANVLPRYPAIKHDLGLSNADLGVAIAAFPLGALLAGVLAGALLRRWGSGNVSVGAALISLLAYATVGFLPSALLFAASWFVAGAMDAVIDVAMNAHGLRVQRLYQRPILNSFHGIWSVGAVTGGLMGSAAAGLAVPLPLHLMASSALFAVVIGICSRFLLPGAESTERHLDRRDDAPTARPWRRPGVLVTLVALGVIGGAAGVTEDAGASWGAIYLTGSLGASAAIGGLPFVALQGMQTIGRLLGDRVVARFGDRAVGRTGGLLVVAGMTLALAVPDVVTTVIGFGVAGLGVATLIPAAMHAADEIPNLPDGSGLTVVSAVIRIGFLLSPPVVGFVADHTSLRVGLLVVPLAGLTILALSRYLAPRRI